jgi:1,4-alpha-glucan branching enzyme
LKVLILIQLLSSYNVGEDFNHLPGTQNYVKRVIKQWIEEYKIDGFRWDLTKGFTQNCTLQMRVALIHQQDRVDVLKKYADYSWSLDPMHYYFEHLEVIQRNSNGLIIELLNLQVKEL